MLSQKIRNMAAFLEINIDDNRPLSARQMRGMYANLLVYGDIAQAYEAALPTEAVDDAVSAPGKVVYISPRRIGKTVAPPPEGGAA